MWAQIPKSEIKNILYHKCRVTYGLINTTVDQILAQLFTKVHYELVTQIMHQFVLRQDNFIQLIYYSRLDRFQNSVQLQDLCKGLVTEQFM